MSLSLADAWIKTFGEALPVAFQLRQRYSDRWLRIHSLHESKRYPDCPAEYEEILRRHNAVASFVLGEDSPCSLFFARFGESREWSEKDLRALIGRLPTHAFTSEDNGEVIQFFATQITWQRSAFDKLICAVADERMGPVLFANMGAQSIYAPYDGGADLFFPSSSEMLAASVEFRFWLSAREDGL